MRWNLTSNLSGAAEKAHTAFEEAMRAMAGKPPEPNQIRPPPIQPVEGEVLHTWTASMPVQVTTAQAAGISIKWEDDEEDDEREVQRVTRTVRVENPDDPNQFVDVEVVDQIVFERLGRRQRYLLNN